MGRDANELDGEALTRLLDVPEGDELDFKRDTYGNGDSDRRAMATDVAAMANHRGGLIIIGVAEGDGAPPHSLSPLDPTTLDDQQLRFRTIVAAKCAPVVDFGAYPVVTNDGGYLVLSIPPSGRRPHAVMVNDDLRYPIRHGSSIRYLTETEVANAYHNRFAAATSQVETVANRRNELALQLQTDHAWLNVALQPSMRGDAPLHRELADALRPWVSSRLDMLPSWFGEAAFYVRGGFGAIASGIRPKSQRTRDEVRST